MTARPRKKGFELDEQSKRAADRAWAVVVLEFPPYRASRETIARLKRLPAERAARNATLPPYEERLRLGDEMRREAGFDPA